MTPFLAGFADELVKVGAFGPQQTEADPYDLASSVTTAMDQYHGMNAATGLKTGLPVPTSPTAKRPTPVPLTTPSRMVSSDS